MSYAPVGPRIVPRHLLSANNQTSMAQNVFENRRTVLSLAKEAIGSVLTSKRRVEGKDGSSAVINTA
jgi:hypothetical protein